jgi:hypothetical protein
MDSVFDLNGSELPKATDVQRDDPAYVLRAIKQFGFSLDFASDRLKKDTDFLKEAMRLSAYVLPYAAY